MIINNNIPALNTFRQLGINQNAMQSSMEKLSSGLRINRAGDDAAGLAISEKMRAQIRGLDQSSRNAQDGISLIQTAEGALQETHSILQRMRELATQAANDTNVDVDREEIQKEINQLTSEINRIGNTTEFNTKILLNADMVDPVAFDNVVNGIQNHGWLTQAEDRIEQEFGLTGNGEDLKINIVNKDRGGTQAYVTGYTLSTNQELTIDIKDFSPSEGPSGDNGTGGFNYSDRILAHEMVHAVMNSSFGVSKTIEMGSWFKEGSAELIRGGDERLENYIYDGAGNIDASMLGDMITRGTELLEGAEWNGNSYDYAAGYLIMKYVESDLGSNNMQDLMGDIKTNVGSLNGNDAVKQAIVSNTTATNFDEFVSNFAALNKTAVDGFIEFNDGPETDTGALGGSGKNAEDLFDNITGVTPGVISKNFNATLPNKEDISSSVTLQIGANNGQSFTIDLRDMRSAALNIAGSAGEAVTIKGEQTEAVYTEVTNSAGGVTNGTDSEVKEYALDVSTHETASAAINVYNAAIENVSSFRSELGAYQNRLEHTISNLDNTSENLSAAESRVRDVDMAREMMEMTRANILSQASQSMLAQANQQPQSVLQLLG